MMLLPGEVVSPRGLGPSTDCARAGFLGTSWLGFFLSQLCYGPFLTTQWKFAFAVNSSLPVRVLDLASGGSSS